MITKDIPSLSKKITYTALLIGVSIISNSGHSSDYFPSFEDIKREAAHLRVDATHALQDLKQAIGHEEERDELVKMINKGTKAVHKGVDKVSQSIKDTIKAPSTFERFKRKVSKLFSCF